MITIAEADLSQTCRARLLEALAMIGERTLSPAEAMKEPPQLVVGGLRAGVRQLSAALIAVGERWPQAPMLVACAEELAQPVVRLQGGRLTLVSQELAIIPLSQAMSTCLGWSSLTACEEPPGATASAESEHERWWARVVVSSAGEAPQATMLHARCLSAWLRPSSLHHAEPPAAALDAWSRQVLAQGSHRTGAHDVPTLPLQPGSGALVHLDPEGLALVHVQAPGPQWQVILSSPQRLPAWCPLGATQVLASRSGDVLILAWVEDARPVPVLGGSGRSIALELARRWQDTAATALVIEVR